MTSWLVLLLVACANAGLAAEREVASCPNSALRTVGFAVPAAVQGPALLQTRIELQPIEQASAVGHHKLLAVLLRTGGPKSKARVESIRRTWARDLEGGSLTLLAPDPWCKAKYGDNHGFGLTCLEAKAHLQLMNRTDWDWLLVVDDDTYVFADRLRDTLRTMNGSKREVYGYPGCGKCGGGRTGFCGGGGYMISRQNLLSMAGQTEAPVSQHDQERFLDHFNQDPDEEWCDVRFACVAQDEGLKPVLVQGLYGNSIKSKEEKHIVDLKQESPPLVLHYITDAEHMRRIHAESAQEQWRDDGKATAYMAETWHVQLPEP